MNTHLGRTQWLKISIVALVRCLLLAGCMVVVSACTKPEQATPEVVPTATTLLPTPVPATPTASPAVETFTDFIPYTSKFHIQQVLSVRLPEEEDSVPPYPTILMFHSGAFEHGDKAELDELGLTLSESGMAVVNANYRLNRYPAPVEDAFCALAWVFREAPTYGFDTGHITAFGVDAGGTLAALLGLITDASDYLAACPNTTLPAHPVAGIVSYNAVYHYGFEEDYLDAWVTRYMDVYLHKTEEGYEQRIIDASPMSYIHADAPPFLLIHGLADQWLSPIQSERFVTALRAEGVPVEYIEVPDADHFMWEYNLDDIQLDQVKAFIRGL